MADRTYRGRVEAPAAIAARIADSLEEADNALSVSVFGTGGGLFEISALYPEPPDQAALADKINQAAGGDTDLSVVIEELPDADWVTLSQGQRGPSRSGRFLVHGSHDRERIVRNRFAIEIDAAQAFGTAHHATTRACLAILDRLAKRGRPDLVLDLGTGTGVLAVAAALAFDRPVIATDNDPVAVAIAKENAHKAGLSRQIHVFEAEGLAHPLFRRLAPDLIVANILAGPLDALAPAMARTLQPGGYVVLSGLTADQTHAVVARYAALGFTLERRSLLDGWGALVMGLRHPRGASN